MRFWVQHALETGAWDSPFARPISRGWAASVRVARWLEIPEGVRVIGVGGATLGGSAKTALVLELGRRVPAGVRAAILTRTYPLRGVPAARVDPKKGSEGVADEPLMLARALEGTGVDVWTGAWRELFRAVHRRYDVLVLDGVLQTRPRALNLALLSVEAAEPWGVGACPPSGNLQAAPQRLMNEAALVVGRSMDGVPSPAWRSLVASRAEGSALLWQQRIVGARTAEGHWVPAQQLRRCRVGALLSLARPQRVLRELDRLGVLPELTVFRADHAGFPVREFGEVPKLDAWLATPKCAVKLENSYQGVPVWVLEQESSVPNDLVTMCFGSPSLVAKHS